VDRDGEGGDVTVERPPTFRRSLVQGFTICPRRTMHEMLLPDQDLAVGNVGHTGNLGWAFHEFMRRYLQTLQEQGEPKMPTQEAVEVMYEVLADLPFTLPFEALDDLRWMVIGFCDIPWPVPLLILAQEKPLTAAVRCADGEVRTVQGTPDIVVGDPPDGIIIIDAKSGRGRPKGPRVEPERGEVVEGRSWLSDTFQGDVYSFLGLLRWLFAERAIFRELHVRSGQIRQATMGRDALEHVERKLSVTLMQLDRAISEGEDSELWRPRPGAHCARQCPVALDCPVPREMRGDGSIETDEQADAAAGALAVLEGVRSTLIGSLKARAVDPRNPLPRVNEDEVAGWKPPVGKGRRFGIWPRADVMGTEGHDEHAA
jgi:hypothetical protein